jgi:hypothetical protein
MLDALGVTRILLTCFSNRLLSRLWNAGGTVEALMGVAFRWEPAVNTGLAAGNRFAPSRVWFYQTFLRHSRLHKLVQRGLSFVGFDEAWTLHPLVFDALVGFLHEFGVPTCSFGEVLQLAARVEQEWIALGWHTAYGFDMPVWQQLQQRRQIVFLRLSRNHRLSPVDAQLLKRVSSVGSIRSAMTVTVFGQAFSQGSSCIGSCMSRVSHAELPAALLWLLVSLLPARRCRWAAVR